MSDFSPTIAAAYATTGAAIDLGRGVHDGQTFMDAVVQAPHAQHREAAAAAAGGGGAAVTGGFLCSSVGKQIEREVVRGLSGLLKTRR